MAFLSLHDVSMRFADGTLALDRVSLDVEEGEFVVLVGPSGCGKSTLLRIVAGLERATSGSIAIEGSAVDELEPGERDIAMVFQNYALYPHMTVAENLAFPLRMRKVAAAERERRVREAAEMLELVPLLARRPGALSGGQMQRVALGRAIVRDPRVFLFDEPLSNLDAQLRGQMRDEIARLHARLGITSLYVTHDQAEAMTMGTRICVLRGGRIEQTGAPLDVFHRPRTSFVATFIGSPPMNLIAPEHVPIPLPEGASGRRLVLGIRPHDVRVGGPHRVRVERVEALGTQTLVHGTLDGAALTLAREGELACEAGDELAVELSSEALHWFDAETGERLE